MEGLLKAACKKRKRPTPSLAKSGEPPARAEVPVRSASEGSQVVRLNVGGREYVTSLSTLRRIEGSMLATMFASGIPSTTTDGAYFLDRDGDLFGFVLSYLRDLLLVSRECWE